MSHFEPRHILAPVDFSHRSTLALRYAAAGAVAYGAKLTVLHVERWEAPPYFTPEDLDRLAREHEAARRAEEQRLGNYLREALSGTMERLDLEPVVAEGAAGETILRTAKEGQAEVIVLGTHGRSGVSRLMMGSVAESVVRGAHVPVLTVRRKEHDFLDATRPESPVRLERILVPVNWTDVARASLEHAAALAQRFGAALTVLYSEEGARTDEEQVREELCSWVTEEVRAQCALNPVVRWGNAAEQIVTYAREMEADLIVLGAHRRPFLEETLFGNTTERVLQHAPCPLLVVPKEG